MKKILSTLTVLGSVFLLISVMSDLHAAQAKIQRFVDNGDGTITDNQTGLMWEKKTGTIGSFVSCSTPTTCADPTDVNNLYSWSITGTAPDGTLFTDFLAKMNCTVSSDGTCGPGGYTDWRVPTLAELRTILTAEEPNCSSSPCIDPIFGPTTESNYLTSTTDATNTSNVWNVNFRFGVVFSFKKFNSTGFNITYARAVRGGR